MVLARARWWKRDLAEGTDETAAMNLKSFVLGVGTGALIYAVASALLSNMGSERRAPVLAPAPEERPASTILRQAPKSESEPEPETEGQAAVRIEGVRDRSQRSSNHAGATDPVASSTSWPESAQQRLREEPKDEDWAYFTERAILDAVSAHSLAGEFHIVYIECRTTLCQIKVNGYGESSVPKWHQIVFDLTQQSWAEFGQRGMSSGVADGQFVIVQDLRRR